MATWTEELNADTRVFRVRFGDGSTISFNVRYFGKMDGWVREDGEAWTALHPYDDRRCYWGATGSIVRKVSAVIAGQQYDKPDMVEVFKHDLKNEGSEFILTNLASENCNQCQSRRDSDFNDIRNLVNNSLQSVIEVDVEKVKQAFREMTNAVEVEGVPT